MPIRTAMMMSPLRSDEPPRQFHLHLSNHPNELQNLIGSPLISMSSGLGMLNLRDIHLLIEESTSKLEQDPSCLHTRAIRGHACMKAKMYDLAVQDFTTILQVRPDDVHGRFSRGMAFFKLGGIEKAHLDFTQVLQLNPNHVMARYARAGCYNTEGEFYQAIEDYTIALQHDEQENENGCFNLHKKRLYLHENAEKLIHEKLGAAGPRGGRNSITNSTIKTQPFQATPYSFSVSSPLSSTMSYTPHALTPQRSVTSTTPVRVAKIRLDIDEPEENNNSNSNNNKTGPAKTNELPQSRPVLMRKSSSQRIVPTVVVNLSEDVEEQQKQDQTGQPQLPVVTSPSTVQKNWQKTLQIAHESLGTKSETVQTSATAVPRDNNNNSIEMEPKTNKPTTATVRRVRIVL